MDRSARSSTRPDREGRDRTEKFDPGATTVHEVLGRVPGAQAILRRFGLDTCCGGDLPLARAAELYGVDLDRLLDALLGRDGGG